MKRKTFLLVLSVSCLGMVLAGQAAWVVEYNHTPDIPSNKIQAVPVAYIVGKEDVKYTSIERALDVATSGEIVCVFPPSMKNFHPTDNPNLPDQVSYEIKRNCEIKPGVTLVLPTDSDTFSGVTNASSLDAFVKTMQEDDRTRGETTANHNDVKASYGRYATESESRYLRVTVTIKSGVVLTNNGTLVISGYLSGGVYSGGGMRGQTSHSYSQFRLEGGASIVQSNANAKTYCYGYIREAVKNNGSHVDFKQGTVYMPLIICDYKGFTFLSGIENAVKQQGCCPFTQLEIRNIDSKTNFYYGSNLYGITNMYVYQEAGFLGTVDETLHNSFKLLGSGTDALINLNDAEHSVLSAKFDTSTQIMKFDFFGGMKAGNLAFQISMRGQTVDLSTMYGFFPVSYRMEVTLNKHEGQSEVTYDLSSQKFKFLPGAKLTVNGGCHINGDELSIFSAFIYGANGQRTDVLFSAGGSYPIKEGAVVVLDSTSTIHMNRIGGIVYCDNSSNVSYTNSDTTVVNEGWNQKQSGVQYVTKYYLQTREKLSVVPVSYQTKKKVFVGMNVFMDPDSVPNPCLPKYAVTVEGTDYVFDSNQGVVFLDAFSNASLKLIGNICLMKKSPQSTNGSYSISNYAYKETINCSRNLIVCAINSNVDISNSNSGINEFEVQSVTVKSLTNKVDGKDPLYVGGDIFLQADIVDENKVYDKTIHWTSSDETIATIDASGKATGVALGQVTFFATCGGVTGSYPSEVISDSSKVGITEAWIEDSSGKSSKVQAGSATNLDRPNPYTEAKYPTWNYNGKYTSKNGTTKFSLKFNPNNAIISKVTWCLYGTSKHYLVDYDSAQTKVNNGTELIDDGSLSVTIKWDGATNANPDGAVLKCNVLDITGQEIAVEFFILHDSGVDIPCILEGTKVMLANGVEKKVEDLTFKDELMVYNHFNGRIEGSQLFFNYHANEDNVVTAKILTLIFEQNISIRTHVDHGFFDADLGRYVYINLGNFDKYLGHKFIYVGSDKKIAKVKLLSATVKEETVRVYSPVSIQCLNVVTNGLLSITGEIEGWFNFFDYIDLKYDPKKMAEDIERYGLYEYEEFKEYLRKDIFDLIPVPYLKVTVGKKLTTKEQIISVMRKYLSDK
ncbi:MAG: Ig-like domain-containing protein [Candidatus Enteromonas sp.]